MTGVHDLSLRQLQYVVAVADTLGFHKAAERCHVSQPTLSAQVKALEDVLGVAIFERDRRRVLVTPAGEALVAQARRILVAAGDLVTLAARAREPLVGEVRVGVLPTVAPYFLPRAMPPLRKKFPRLKLMLREETTASIVAGLREGRLDAGIVAKESDLGESTTIDLFRDPFVLAVPSADPLAANKRVATSDLEARTVLLLDDGHCLRSQALAVCSREGATESDFRATSLATLVQMVSSGAGITLLPELAVAVESRRAKLEVRRFRKPVPFRTIVLAHRPHAPLAPSLREIARSLASSARQSGDE